MNTTFERVGTISAIVGPVLLGVGTWLHPMHEDPADTYAAFAEYVADPWWVTSHLVQLIGVVLMIVALLVLADTLKKRSESPWIALGSGAAIASLTIAASLQAVDGIALKGALDHWASSTGTQKEMAYHAAFAVRQIEIGLASMGNLTIGLTEIAFGLAIGSHETDPRVASGLAILAGVGSFAAGIAIAYSGFSTVAMNMSMAANLTGMAWMYLVALILWRGTEEKHGAAF